VPSINVTQRRLSQSSQLYAKTLSSPLFDCTFTLWVCTLWASDVAMNTENLLAIAATPALLRAVFDCHQHCLSDCMGVFNHTIFLQQVSDVAVRRLLSIVTSTVCLSVWASVITSTSCNRCQMWRSGGSPKMQALWLHRHCVYLSDCMGVCDHADFLQ